MSIALSYLCFMSLASITARRSSSVMVPMRLCGGSMNARCTMPGTPFSSRQDTSASPTPSSIIAVCVSNAGFVRNVCAAVFTAFCSLGVYALSACCTRFESCANTLSGMSDGLCEMKYMPTPFERISFTTCSIFCTSTFGASLNKRCASSKKNTISGFSASPRSGSFSNSSLIKNSMNVAYSVGFCTSFTLCSTFMYPLPCSSRCIQSRISIAGSPKNSAPPSSSSVIRLLCIAPRLCALMFPYSAENSARFSPT